MYKVVIRCSSAFGICEEKDGQTLEQVRNLIDEWGDYDTVSDNSNKLEMYDGEFYAISPFLEASIEIDDEEGYSEENYAEELRIGHIYSWFYD